MESRVIAELILHLGRIVAWDSSAGELSSVQWAALRYLAYANRFSRTPSAFAAFHGTTRGTASQTIKALVARGYLKQTRSTDDGRSVKLDLTGKAKAIIADDPMETLVRAVDDLPPGIRTDFGDVLQRTLGSVTTEAGTPQFGTCRNCRHLHGAGCCGETPACYECGFLSEPLSEAELDALCIRFATARKPPRDAGRRTGLGDD